MRRKVKAGELNQRVVIRRSAKTTDSHGQAQESWSTLQGLWAKHMAGGGNESYSNSGIHAQTFARFWVRVGADVTVKDRIQWNDVEFDVLSVDQILDRTILEIKVKAPA